MPAMHTDNVNDVLAQLLAHLVKFFARKGLQILGRINLLNKLAWDDFHYGQLTPKVTVLVLAGRLFGVNVFQ
jgi:hypothetical protein